MSGGCVRFYEYRDNTDSRQKTAKKEDLTRKGCQCGYNGHDQVVEGYGGKEVAQKKAYYRWKGIFDTSCI